jgi:hypothetical protein
MLQFSSSIASAAAAISLSCATPALAAPDNDADSAVFRIKPVVDARARYETVEQGALEANAVTVRVRAGAEAALGGFTLLAEGEATVALTDEYNAFPFALPGESQRRPQYAVVADPENAELSRLQLRYAAGKNAITLGRQRINLDDQRWVGSVGWRQNEQTFDAVRAEGTLGRVNADFAYAIAQRSIFGEDADARAAYGGDIVMAGLSTKTGPVDGKLFAYLLDYDETFFAANSSQTYGGIVRGVVPIGAATKLAVRASYARQSDFGSNPFDYAADYWAFEGGTTLAGFALAAGWERLGSDNGRAVQTPAATLHKFNGWADLFLTTPPAGLDDAYVSVGKTVKQLGPLAALTVGVAYHQFDSAAGDVEYGTEWDASIGFKAGGIGWLLKFADYRAVGFGADTRKLWLQAEWSL